MRAVDVVTKSGEKVIRAMGEGEFRAAITERLDKMGDKIDGIAIAVAVLGEKSTRAVDEGSVQRIVKGALSEHLDACKGKAGNGEEIKISGINGTLIKALIYVAVAAASAFGGSQIL